MKLKSRTRKKTTVTFPIYFKNKHKQIKSTILIVVKTHSAYHIVAFHT